MDNMTFPSISGEVILPDDAAYPELQNIFNQTGKPALIVRPAGSHAITDSGWRCAAAVMA
jgi:hypothetical protein